MNRIKITILGMLIGVITLLAYTAPSYANKWFQTEVGNVHVEGDLDAGSVPFDKYFSIKSSDDLNDSGIISVTGSSYVGLLGSESGGWFSSDWIHSTTEVSTDVFSKYSYDYYDRMFPNKTSDPRCGTGESNRIDEDYLDSIDSGVYFIDCSGATHTRVNEARVKAGDWYVFFINSGTLNPQVQFNTTNDKSITVDEGGFIAFIVRGNIRISNGTIGSETEPGLQSLLIGDRIDFQEGTPNQKFFGEGSFVAHGGFDLRMNVGAPSDDPIEHFIYRPDFLRSMIENKPTSVRNGFMKKRVTYREVNP